MTTALVGLAVAVLGVTSVQATQAKNEAQDDATGLSTEVGALQSDLDAARRAAATSEASRQRLSQENKDLSARVAALEGQLPPDVDPGTVESATPAIRHRGVVTLTDGGDAADINAPATDATWGSGTIESYQDGAVELNFGNVYFRSASLLRLESGTATYASCKSSTGYAPAGQVDPATLEGKNVCLRTDAGRYATARLVGQSPRSVKLELTTWEMV